MAYGGGLTYALQTLEHWGITDVLIPFILVFTLVFAVMQKTKILGKGKKNYNVMVALVMALAVVIPHVMGTYPPNGDVVEIINKALPNISLVGVAILMLLLIIGTFGGEVKLAGTGLAGWAVIFSIIAVAAIFLGASGVFGHRWSWFRNILNPETEALIIIILVFGIIMWFVTKEDGEDKKKTKEGEKFLDSWGKVLGGKSGDKID